MVPDDFRVVCGTGGYVNLLEMIAKDRAERIATLRTLLLEKYDKEYEQGSQLVVDVSIHEGDEPAVLKLMDQFEAEGIKMTYHNEEMMREKEYVLIWAHQPKRKV